MLRKVFINLRIPKVVISLEILQKNFKILIALRTQHQNRVMRERLLRHAPIHVPVDLLRLLFLHIDARLDLQFVLCARSPLRDDLRLHCVLVLALGQVHLLVGLQRQRLLRRVLHEGVLVLLARVLLRQLLHEIGLAHALRVDVDFDQVVFDL